MLVLSGTLIGKPILSLRTEGAIATVTSPIINPHNLKIEGFYCEDNRSRDQLVLLFQDIREISSQGFFVNDHEVLAEAKELVRLRKVIDLDFELIGKKIVTTSKEKVGKVSDYAIETNSLYIQKIYASQSLMKSLTSGSLSIDRTQIVEVTNTKVVINKLQATVASAAPVAA